MKFAGKWIKLGKKIYNTHSDPDLEIQMLYIFSYMFIASDHLFCVFTIWSTYRKCIIQVVCRRVKNNRKGELNEEKKNGKAKRGLRRYNYY